MNKRIDGIVFDLGGVVLSSFEFPFYDDMSKKFSISPKALALTAERGWPAMETGKESNSAMWRETAKKLGLQPADGRVLARMWLEYYRKGSRINKRTVAIIERLRKNYKISALSNTQKEHTSFNRRRGLFKHFDAVTLSCNVGSRKPQKGIFLAASKQIKIPFKHLLFIDDDIRWIRSAKKYGLKTIHFRSPEQLTVELKKLLK